MAEKNNLNDNGDETWVYKFDEEAAHKFRVDVKNKSKRDPNAPIIVYIDSYGGNVDGMAKMIDTMDEIPNPIITVCMGKSMSAGAILLSHGDMRFCSKNSRIMIHELSAGAFGNVRDIANDTDELMRMNRHWIGLLAKNCCISGGYNGIRKVIKDNDNQSIYLDAVMAKQFGIVDCIGVPTTNAAVLYEVLTLKEKEKKHMRMEDFEKLQKKIAKQGAKKKARKKKATKKKTKK